MVQYYFKRDSPIAVQSNMSWHFPVWYTLRGLLKLDCLIIHAVALVRSDKEGIHGTPGYNTTPSLRRWTLTG